MACVIRMNPPLWGRDNFSTYVARCIRECGRTVRKTSKIRSGLRSKDLSSAGIDMDNWDQNTSWSLIDRMVFDEIDKQGFRTRLFIHVPDCDRGQLFGHVLQW